MLSRLTSVEDILELAPEWDAVLRSLKADGKAEAHELLNRLGAQAIYKKALSLGPGNGPFVNLIKDAYLQPHMVKMLFCNQNLRRFHSQRRLDASQQRDQSLSLSADLSCKLEAVLNKHLSQGSEDGYKILLPAYIQRSVQNAVVDYVRQEWMWEKSTLQDLNLDPSMEDPRQNVAEDARYAPENEALSKEQVAQLNQLRGQLENMLKDESWPREPMLVLDCLFGLGLTEHSNCGQEMTMRECCERLSIPGETQARQIARCQVFLDKGLDLVRQQVRKSLPGIVEAWQGELNVNTGSRRELSQQLGMTETEVEKLIKGRQFTSLEEVLEKGVVKPDRLKEFSNRGAVAAFVPVDINSATARDIIDILGLTKELSQKLVAERPFAELNDLTARGLLSKDLFAQARARGAVLRAKESDGRRLDLNRIDVAEIEAAGVPQAVASLAARGRPFLTWSELEDYLACEPPIWAILRQKFCLGLASV